MSYETERHRYPEHLKRPERIGLRLDAGVNDRLDEAAVRRRTSKSEIIRRAIDRDLAADAEVQA
jgi:predicted transcriptional regulator